MSFTLPYVPLDEARAAGGLRMVLNAGAPGPWSEAAKGILRYKGIDFVPVAHLGGMENVELVAWTGIANAPVAMYGDERPRSHWSEILLLAERLAPEPRLIPEDEADRVRMFGIAHEICGEDGLGWNRRLQMFDRNEATARAKVAEKDPAAAEKPNVPIARMRYRYSANADIAVAEARQIAILNFLTDLLRRQEAAGSPWFIGDTLTAADIYWAAFSNLVAPMAPDVCPMPDFYRHSADRRSPDLDAAISPALLAHRDRVARLCFDPPMRF